MLDLKDRYYKHCVSAVGDLYGPSPENNCYVFASLTPQKYTDHMYPWCNAMYDAHLPVITTEAEFEYFKAIV